MAKTIFATSDEVETICTELRNVLDNSKCFGNIEFKKSFKSDDRTATLCFTPVAWIKMTALVSRFATEVQWHGLVRRISEHRFEIYDILVPPHEVSGTTVTSEYKSYIDWMDKLDDDTFNAVRFHGHSHVNMSVIPSTVDNKYRRDLVTQLPKPTDDDDVFYIFLIINKKHEWSAEIYDFTNNALYNTNEILVQCLLGNDDLDSFVAEAKKVAVTHINNYEDLCKVKNKKRKGKGNYRALHDINEYYETIYGEDWDEYMTGSIAEEDIDDDDNNLNSPFYVKEH